MVHHTTPSEYQEEKNWFAGRLGVVVGEVPSVRAERLLLVENVPRNAGCFGLPVVVDVHLAPLTNADWPGQSPGEVSSVLMISHLPLSASVIECCRHLVRPGDLGVGHHGRVPVW